MAQGPAQGVARGSSSHTLDAKRVQYWNAVNNYWRNSGNATYCPLAGEEKARCDLLCYASHMAESPMELILEVRYAWH